MKRLERFTLDHPPRKRHPVNDVLPMMRGKDLDELIDSIKTHGLLMPIVVAADNDDMLLDGKCRLEACTRAGVTPIYVRLPADMDPQDFIVSENLLRQHCPYGRTAMWLALVHPDDETARDFDLLTTEPTGARAMQRGMAQFVRLHAPHLVPLVLHSGAMRLNEAYAEAVKARQAERELQRLTRQLRADAPDIAARVADGDMPLEAGLAERDAREAERLKGRRQLFADLAALVCVCSGFVEAPETLARLPAILADANHQHELRRYFKRGTAEFEANADAILKGAEAAARTLRQVLGRNDPA